MKSHVIDASVAMKWFLPEPQHEEALIILQETTQFYVPEHFFAEMTNILWKKIAQKEITDREAVHILKKIAQIPWEVIDTRPFLNLALQIAFRWKITTYDSLYFLAALQQKSVLITADRFLYDALVASPFSQSILLLAQV